MLTQQPSGPRTPKQTPTTKDKKKRIRTKQTQKNPLIKATDNRRRKIIINPNVIICLLVTTTNNNNIIIIIIITLNI